jgi:hypothetical protein
MQSINMLKASEQCWTIIYYLVWCWMTLMKHYLVDGYYQKVDNWWSTIICKNKKQDCVQTWRRWQRILLLFSATAKTRHEFPWKDVSPLTLNIVNTTKYEFGGSCIQMFWQLTLPRWMEEVEAMQSWDEICWLDPSFFLMPLQSLAEPAFT